MKDEIKDVYIRNQLYISYSFVFITYLYLQNASQ